MVNNKDFVERLGKAFGGESMARVAKRLKVPHATVRNYFLGRLPSPEVLIKIAEETGVSLNWLLMGTGDVYSNRTSEIDLNMLIEEKITEIVDRKVTEKLLEHGVDSRPARAEFNVDNAVRRFDDPQQIMGEWFRYEGREYPADYGVVFFRGWETFSVDDKIAAVRDAKRVLDRSLQK
jgi:transcriptional regulator with XRE-family HTH domain